MYGYTMLFTLRYVGLRDLQRLILKDLQRLGWPEFTANESAVVTETLHHYGCRLAVGGSVRMTKEIFEVDGKATLEGAKLVPDFMCQLNN